MFTRQADDCWFLEFRFAVKPETKMLKYWSGYMIPGFKIWHNSGIQMHISTQTQQNTSLRLLPHLVQVMDSNLSARSIPDWFCGFRRQVFYIFHRGRLKCLQVCFFFFLLSYDCAVVRNKDGYHTELHCVQSRPSENRTSLSVRVFVCLSLRCGLLFPLNYVKSHSPHVNISSSLPAKAVTLSSSCYEKQRKDWHALFWQSWKVWWSMVMVRGYHSRQTTIVFRSGMISMM